MASEAECGAHILATLLRVVSDATRANASEEERKEALSVVLHGLQQGLLVVRAPQCTCGSGCTINA